MGTKISEATLRENLKGSESLPIVDSDLPKGRTTTQILKDYCATPIGEAEGTAFDGARGKAVEDTVDKLDSLFVKYIVADGNKASVLRVEQSDSDKIELVLGCLLINYGGSVGYSKLTRELLAATDTKAGVMSAADKKKLDSLSTEAFPTFSLTDDLASGSGVISSLVWERLTAARTANTPIVVVNDMGSLPVANVAILSFGHNAQQQGTTDIIMPARINDLEDYTVTQTVYQITGGGSTYQIATVTKNLKFYDSGDGTKFLSDDGTYKAIEIPDISNLATKDEVNAKVSTKTYNADKATFATKTELNAKVSGTGVTQMQVVTALPESPDANTLYIVTAAEETE